MWPSSGSQEFLRDQGWWLLAVILVNGGLLIIWLHSVNKNVIPVETLEWYNVSVSLQNTHCIYLLENSTTLHDLLAGFLCIYQKDWETDIIIDWIFLSVVFSRLFLMLSTIAQMLPQFYCSLSCPQLLYVLFLLEVSEKPMWLWGLS